MKFSSTVIIKWIPYIGILYAFYESYGQRGYQGLLADLKSLTAFSFAGLKTKITQILVAIAIYVFAVQWLAKEVSNRWIKAAIRTIAYYILTKTLLDAIKSGAGYGGTGKNFPSGSGNSYNPFEAGAGGA